MFQTRVSAKFCSHLLDCIPGSTPLQPQSDPMECDGDPVTSTVPAVIEIPNTGPSAIPPIQQRGRFLVWPAANQRP